MSTDAFTSTAGLTGAPTATLTVLRLLTSSAGLTSAPVAWPYTLQTSGEIAKSTVLVFDSPVDP